MMIQHLKRLFLSSFVLLLGLSALVPFAQAVDPVNVSGSNQVAIHGVDSVAYFTEAKVVQGKALYSAEWRGARWQFASEEHRQLFLQNPEKYDLSLEAIAPMLPALASLLILTHKPGRF